LKISLHEGNKYPSFIKVFSGVWEEGKNYLWLDKFETPRKIKNKREGGRVSKSNFWKAQTFPRKR